MPYIATANITECVASLKGRHITIICHSISNLMVMLAPMDTSLAQSGFLGPPLYEDDTSI